MKRKIIKCAMLLIVLSVVVACFCPKPLIRKVNDSNIISIMYRSDTWEELHFLYPSQAVPSLDENELLKILNQSMAVIELFPPAIDGIPSETVTIMISVKDGDRVKNITLGGWNRVTIQSSNASYQIVDADSVLNRVLDFLQIDENIIRLIE